MFFFVGSRMFDVQSDVTIRLSTHTYSSFQRWEMIPSAKNTYLLSFKTSYVSDGNI